MVDHVVALYKKALNSSSVKGTVEGLRSLEETVNKDDGSRFLLEMDVHVLSPVEEIVHTSEYVYLKKSSSQLCHTSNFQWTKNAEVHFVVSGVFIMYVCTYLCAVNSLKSGTLKCCTHPCI